MHKWLTISVLILLLISCKQDSNNIEVVETNKVCSSTVYDEENADNETLFFYPDKDSVNFNPDLSGFDSIKIAINCLNIYDENCWKLYDGKALVLYNRSDEPNGWADGPFTRYIAENAYESADPDAKRNNLDKLNVVRFQLFQDSSVFEEVYHIGVGIEKPSNYMVMIDYENLDDMIGPEGNYGIGDGYHIKCKALKKDYVMGANYIVQSTKQPEFKCSGITRCNVEKPVVFSVYDQNGKRAIQQHVGGGLSAGGSAHYPVKGLKVTARSAYGQSRMSANIFGEPETYKNMRIRLGGSGQFLSPCNHVMDAIGHDIYGERGLNNEFMSLYMNGYQWGIGYLQEKLDEHFIEKRYGFDSDFVDVLEIVGLSNGQLLCNDSAMARKLDEKGELESYGFNELVSYDNNYCWLATVKDGNGKAFTNFYNEFLQGNYERLNQKSLFDYLAQIDFVTYHDPGRSCIFFCDDRRDPTWYVQGFDFDRSFSDNPEVDFWNVILNPNDIDAFRELVRRYFSIDINRQAFIIHYQDLLNTKYSLDVLTPIIRNRIEEFEKEVRAHEYAWTPNSLVAEEWLANCFDRSIIEEFINKRHPAARHYLAQRFMSETRFVLKDQKMLNIEFPNIDLGEDFYIQFNTLQLKEDFKGRYYPWPSMNLEIKNLPDEYEFVGWQGLEGEKNIHTNFLMSDNLTIKPIIKRK